MPNELDPAAILAALIILGVLGYSAILWILHRKRSKSNLIPKEEVPAWSIGWINFGIFICAIIVAIASVQLLAKGLINAMDLSSAHQQISDHIEPTPNLDPIEGAAEVETSGLTPWNAVLAVMLLQIPMLIVFYGLRKFYPNNFAGSLNSNTLTIRQAFPPAIRFFIQYLPIIWFVSFAWSVSLTILQKLNIIDTFPPQELIQILSEGGSATAITLLVISAIVLAPIVEEIIFRGGVYRFLKSQSTLLSAQIISGAFFAIMHGNLMSFLPLVVVGVLLARVYEHSGNILTPICFHACFNGFNLLMLFIMNYSSIPIG